MCLGCIKLNYIPCNRTLSSPFLLVLKIYLWLYPIKPPLSQFVGCIPLRHHFPHHPPMNFSWQLSMDGVLAPSAAWITAKAVSTKPATTTTSSRSVVKDVHIRYVYNTHTDIYMCVCVYPSPPTSNRIYIYMYI